MCIRDSNYAFGMAGYDAALKRTATAGSLTLNGGGTVSTGDMDANDAGTASSDPGITGTYTMTANGRGTMRLFLGGQFYVDYILWMASPTDVFLISSDTLKPTTPPAIPAPTFLTFGEALLQQPVGTSGNFDDSALNGTGVVTGTGLDGTAGTTFAGLLTGNGSGCLLYTSRCV